MAGNQLGHGLPAVYQVVGTAREIRQGDAVGINAELVIQGGEDFAEVHPAFRNLAPEAVRRADHLTSFHPSTRQQRREDHRKVRLKTIPKVKVVSPKSSRLFAPAVRWLERSIG